ncbi:MAG: asparagine synthase (glutamine-hydrolyzing) [Gammaproteobacteria bacterium]|nr:asparagine synthase (glutamine-hydrolyzing) [Gammaproteobacteria bacterium]
MCGIAGFISTRTRDRDAMLQALQHRGPDASGRFAIEAGGRQVFLGHTRLSIIDLSEAGTQPMFTANRRIAIVFNGEIYNFQALKQRYLGDVEFRSATDTEVLLALYERMGLACLQHLNGDFAVAILDQDRGKLLLMRDRIGVKPLYVWQSGEELVFGSEVKALFAAGVVPELDAEQVQPYFVFKYVPGNATLFKGVMRLPPGNYLEYDLATGRVSRTAYWQPATATDTSISYRDACDLVRETVADATRLRLVADVPVGTFLSGGLDSSIIGSLVRDEINIAHYCARQSASHTRQEGTVSDFYYAKKLADDWHLNFRAIDIGADELTLEQISTTAYFADDLIADSAQIPTYLITEGAGVSSRVFLSGMGADELFLGYAGHLLTMLSWRIGQVPGHQVALDIFGKLAEGRGAFKSIRRYLYRLGKYRNYPDYQAAIFSLVGDFERSASLVEGDRDALIDKFSGYFPAGGDAFEGLKRFEFDNYLQKNLAYTDRMAMANSVEVRVPFLDHRVVDLAYSLPRGFKLGNFGETKRVLKDAFRAELPAYVIQRRKAGFAMPIRSLFGSRDRLQSMLDMALLAEIIPVNVAAIQLTIDRHIDGSEDNSSLIYALISFQEWYKLFFR